MITTWQLNRYEGGGGLPYTLGKLSTGAAFCYTLEDAIREQWDASTDTWHWDATRKVYGQTAIPSGSYRIEAHFSPHFGRVMPFLLNVPDFTNIMLHPGNSTGDTEGCILVGRAVSPVDATLMNSRPVSDVLNRLATNILSGPSNELWITITNPPHNLGIPQT